MEAFTPESIWAIRWASGCSTAMTMPGMSSIDSVMSLRISCRVRFVSGLNVMMISDMFTPSACSSSSARPVRRRKPLTSSISISRLSTVCAISLDFCSEVPGGRTTFSCATPSLNGGSKSCSIFMANIAARAVTQTAIATSGFANVRLNRMTVPVIDLRDRRSRPSFSRDVTGAFGSSQ